MNLGNEDGLDGEYVPSPDERVRTLVAYPTVRLQDWAAIKRLRAREVFGDVDTTAAELFAVIAQGVLTAQTDLVLPLKDAAAAHRALEGRRTTGATVFAP
jgi:NADPH:quinone reductase-like Zn-dependent oxidoreductase